jgi:hypothetical protein
MTTCILRLSILNQAGCTAACMELCHWLWAMSEDRVCICKYTDCVYLLNVYWKQRPNWAYIQSGTLGYSDVCTAVGRRALTFYVASFFGYICESRQPTYICVVILIM